MIKKINVITGKEWGRLYRRQQAYNYTFKVIEQQTEEMLEEGGFSLNNFASNAAPSEVHALNENKSKSKVIVKDVDTGISDGKFRIMVTFE